MATQANILACKILWTEKPDELWSMGLQRVRHDGVTEKVKVKVKVKVAQPCLTCCNPMDYSLPGFSIHGIFQARVLEWVAISFFRGSSRPRDQTWVSLIVGRCFYCLSHH